MIDGLSIRVTRAEGARCPRCRRVTGEGRFNHDQLCDRCCHVLLDDHPAHPSVPGIQASYAQQRKRWAR